MRRVLRMSAIVAVLGGLGWLGLIGSAGAARCAAPPAAADVTVRGVGCTTARSLVTAASTITTGSGTKRFTSDGYRCLVRVRYAGDSPTFAYRCARDARRVAWTRRHAVGSARFLVNLNPARHGFGGFRDSPVADRTDLTARFGAPDPAAPPIAGGRCVLTWAAIGVRVELMSHGLDGRPCDGLFARATLTDPRWHTATGVRVGSSDRQAARAAERTCGARVAPDDCGPFRGGYGLVRFASTCAPGRAVRTFAHVTARRVDRIELESVGC